MRLDADRALEQDGAGPYAGSAPAARVEITYFTDPLCCWCWAFEPQWRRLRFEFGPHLAWRYRFVGMIPDWKSYSDPINAVNRPVQMGPVWAQAGALSGMPVDARIWVQDPPGSSYPPCLACKTAELQSPEACERLLRRLREAAMMEARNVTRREVIFELADEVACEAPQVLDAGRFRSDFDSGAALEALRDDIKETRYLEIGRYPTLVLRAPGQRSIALTGFQPYAQLLGALRHMAPNVAPVRKARDRTAYEAFWGRVMSREAEEALGTG